MLLAGGVLALSCIDLFVCHLICCAGQLPSILHRQGQLCCPWSHSPPRLVCVWSCAGCVSGDDAIKHLLSRGAHRRFSYKSLGVMLAWYFVCAALAAGSAISSGLFVPMLMMGALVGRLVGLATTDVADKYGSLLSSKCMSDVAEQ